MDTRTKRGLMGIGVLAVAFLTIAMVVVVDAPPLKMRHLILDTPGCEGARRLGLTPSPIDRGVCDLQVKAASGSQWITIGHTKIHANRVVAMRDAE